MRVLITGSSNGIGRATAEMFLNKHWNVVGFDKKDAPKELLCNELYHHYTVDCSKKELLPELPNCDIIINNAGEQNGKDDIRNNLYSSIYVTEKYAFQENIKAVLFNACNIFCPPFIHSLNCINSRNRVTV